MWNPNIWEIAKKAWTTFKKWQSWNPNWQPKKLLTVVNEELKKEWYPSVKERDIVWAYLQLFNLDTNKVKELHSRVKKWENMNFFYSLVLKNLHSKRSMEQVEKMIDRAFWKATQKQDLYVSWELSIWNILSDIQWQTNKK